ncbi:hypothetical protein E2562_026377 [Oryza meyeriana var. granulata]|uniref:non-specific serine/threonine protein kinase n=1 Tax=Oryza meyeriana var. granulata TaxID=110450 RepID=A0A6G1DPI0_9ORYZ|nr:hypothetical protein E2562_026377 [Oryza meyeriana var. granulata]
MCSWRQFTLLLFIPCLSAAAVVDTQSTGESLTGDRTLVSEEGKFELGFFCPAGDSNYYVGIWYREIPGRTVIWVMNRDRPVAGPSSSELTVAQDGNLVLLLLKRNQRKETIWSSSSSTRTCNDEAAEAVLLDTGNPVLRCRKVGNSPAITWQSFDHPTDTLMPGAWIGLNKSTGEYQALRSWRTATDPSTGLYMDRVDPHGSGQYAFMWNVLG